jgi:Cof subfamily protein (haloacid dehalogenase superfamily)
MGIKMIVTDLDDTLLRRDKTVSEYTADIFRRCRAAGIRTAFATARGHPEKVAPMELFDGRIMCNGAVLFADGITHKRTIPYQEARPLLIACAQRGLRVSSQFGDMHYYPSPYVAAAWPDIMKWQVVDFSHHTIDVEKLNVDAVTAEDAAFIKRYLTDSMYLKVARDGLGMVMHKSATKSYALAELARIWDIAQSEIVAFGDDLNDMDMLSCVGIGVAMSNALDEIKAAADYACGDCDDDGVAKWLEEYALRGASSSRRDWLISEPNRS